MRQLHIISRGPENYKVFFFLSASSHLDRFEIRKSFNKLIINLAGKPIVTILYIIFYTKVSTYYVDRIRNVISYTLYDQLI